MTLPCETKDCLVVLLVPRRVRPTSEAAFEAVWERLLPDVAAFEGFLSATLLRPNRPYEPNYRLVFKFNRMDRLKRWETSDEFHRWRTRIEPWTLGRPPHSTVYCSECSPPPEGL